MSFCDEKLLKLNERMDQPLPTYSKNQINRTRVFNKDLNVASKPIDSKSLMTTEVPQIEIDLLTKEPSKKLDLVHLEDEMESAKEHTPSEEPLELVKRSDTVSLRSSDKNANIKNINKMSRNSNSNQDQEEPNDAQTNALDCFFPGKKSKPSNCPASPFLLNKKIKESQAFSSDSDSPLINPSNAQKNKITDYFKIDQCLEKPIEPEFMEVKDFSNANAIIKHQQDQPVDKGLNERWEAMLREKDKEILKLSKQMKAAEEEKAEFKQKVKNHISTVLLELENAKRFEKKNLIISEKTRIGEYIPYREGSKFKEVWIDGYELRCLKEELARIVEQKEVLESIRKKFKKRTSKIMASEDKHNTSNPLPNQSLGIPPVINGHQGVNGSLNGILSVNHNLLAGSSLARVNPLAYSGIPSYLFANVENSDSSNPVPAISERILEETKERVHAQILNLSKEEAFLKEKIDFVERQKENYIKIAKNMYEEENCRFGKINVNDQEKRWPLLSSRYQMLSLLGKGGFSEVYRAFDCDELRDVACKIHQLNPSWSEHQKSNYIRHALRENQVHRMLSHPNIVTHYDSVEIDSNSFCTVLEFCNGPDLSAFLKKYKILLEKDARSIIKQILTALKFLNENDKKVIHYDLKPQNILFHNGMIKISDFGLCKVMSQDETRLELTSQGVGTYWYLPPECFSHEYPKISTKVDIWSIGVIYFEMLYGIKPFGNEMTQERILKEGIMLKAYSLDFPAKPAVAPETKEFIKKCLEYHQENRFNVFEAWAFLNKL
jgi:hypothetical protein